jgi:paraquat-inducible protein A
MVGTLSSRRGLVLAGLAATIGLLIPGLVTPVIHLRGTLDPEGIEQLVPQILEQGVSDETLAALRPMINPAILPLIELTPGGLKGALVSRLGPEIGQALAGGPEIEVYQQTRSILGSVRQLYRVGAATPATLILLFSVIVPFAKSLMVLWAIYRRDPTRRRRTLTFVEIIAKWSMADVFAVALFIAYLAAAASQTPPGSTAYQVVSFSATLGPGFYWFAAYCLVSLAQQQLTARWIMAETILESQP